MPDPTLASRRNMTRARRRTHQVIDLIGYFSVVSERGIGRTGRFVDIPANRADFGQSWRGSHATDTQSAAHVRRGSHPGHQARCRTEERLPALLIGLQHLCCNEDFRQRLFWLPGRYILPGTSRKTGRPGMEMWRILVMCRRAGAMLRLRPHAGAGEPAPDPSPVSRSSADLGRRPVRAADNCRQCQPAAPGTAGRGQSIDRGERPCCRKKSLARPSR